jgi:hypothetical protein
MRASGIPAQYAQGTLPLNPAQKVVLSMFPQPLVIVGCLPADTQTADPANNSQLLSETEDSWWFQFE